MTEAEKKLLELVLDPLRAPHDEFGAQLGEARQAVWNERMDQNVLRECVAAYGEMEAARKRLQTLYDKLGPAASTRAIRDMWKASQYPERFPA